MNDPQAGFPSAQVGEIQVLSAYVPNGQKDVFEHLGPEWRRLLVA